RPRCEPVKHTFAPGAGAPTSEGGVVAAGLNSAHYPISCRSPQWRRLPAPGLGLRCATHSRGNAAGGVHGPAGPCGSSHGAGGGLLPGAHAAAAAVPAAGSGCDGGSPGAAGHGAAGGDAGCTAAADGAGCCRYDHRAGAPTTTGSAGAAERGVAAAHGALAGAADGGETC